MPDYSLAAYTIRVKPRNAPSDKVNYLPLSNFDNGGSDALQFIYAFCASAQDEPVRDKTKDKYLSTTTVIARNRTVRATIEAGSHGYQATLRDVETHVDSYARKTTDAELLPLRNMFFIGQDSPVGLFITERVGIRGLKTTLVTALSRSFAGTYPGYVIEINALAPEGAVKASLEEGSLKKIRLVRYGIPHDIADQYILGEHEEELGAMELVLRPERRFSFSKKKISDALDSGEIAGLLEIRGLDYHDIKLEVKVGKSLRTLTVTEAKPPRVTFPVNEDQVDDPAGRPTDGTMRKESIRVARELGEHIGLPISTIMQSDFIWTQAMKRRRVEIVDVES